MEAVKGDETVAQLAARYASRRRRLIAEYRPRTLRTCKSQDLWWIIPLGFTTIQRTPLLMGCHGGASVRES